MAEVKQSVNGIVVVGTLKETNLKFGGVTERKLNNDGVVAKCDCITKVVFKNPAFVVESDGKAIEVDIKYDVLEKKLDKDGNIIDNPKFKELKTILDTYVCGQTRVQVNGVLSSNEYVDSREFEYKVYNPKIDISGAFEHMSSTNVPEQDSTKGEITGVVSKIVPEYQNEEETGRLNVELYTFDYKGATFPVRFTVESDIAEDVQDFYEVNDSVQLYYEVKTIQKGNTQPMREGGFGRRESTRTGWTVTEYSICGGDPKFEEESEYFIEAETMTKAINERNMMIEEQISKKKAKESNTTSSPKGASSFAKTSPFGAPTSTSNTKKSPF